MTPAEVDIGQVWVDRDKRMQDRRVKIIGLARSADRETDRVMYAVMGQLTGRRLYTSRLSRFVKAFRLDCPVVEA